ncbi:MAG: NnrU family protein [Ignavibacteria bacterium]|nr:NnrU family protein [Ignavibacteria bacterium]
MIDYAIDVLIIILGFTLFAISHSVLASFKIKKIIAKRVGNYMAFYRLTYNIISVIIVILLILYLPKPDVIIYDLAYPYDIIILVPQFLSLAGFIWSLIYIGTKEFLGIEQVKRWFNNQYDANQLDEKMTLTFEGPYKYIRHPIFLFGGLFLLLRPVMGFFYLTCLICIIFYIYIGSFYEEKRLIEKFGERYMKYRKAVPGFFPVRLFNPYKEN